MGRTEIKGAHISRGQAGRTVHGEQHVLGVCGCSEVELADYAALVRVPKHVRFTGNEGHTDTQRNRHIPPRFTPTKQGMLMSVPGRVTFLQPRPRMQVRQGNGSVTHTPRAASFEREAGAVLTSAAPPGS